MWHWFGGDYWFTEEEMNEIEKTLTDFNKRNGFKNANVIESED